MPFRRIVAAPSDRAGIAMATAMGGLVIIGVMIAGVFFTSNQELRVGTNTFVQERAFRAAEFGVNTALANWSNFEMLLLPIGGTKKLVYDSSAKGWIDSVTITRLNAIGFLIGSTGTAFGGIQGTSRRRTALLVRLSVPAVDVRAALLARNDTEIESDVINPVKGLDASPTGWTSCPPLEGLVKAVAMREGADLDLDCPFNLCLLGGLFSTAEAADTSTYFEFGDESWTSLLAYNPKVYTQSDDPPNTIEPAFAADGGCDKGNEGNWGDPNRATPAGACESYFPIIHAKGSGFNVKLKNGSGQGILLVEGDLEIKDDFKFYGPIIVRGKFEIKDDARVHGSVLAANTHGGDNKVKEEATIRYSSCAVRKAFENAIPPKRVVERAWMEVF